ncbi:hypothetical protein [Enterobacter asburiae]|uniref:hypothetical protein n=1 Tax=Enterobacter asburiae TaxID=61645 RepID=UPI0016526928|nr:hypothetical protein [Enterobacter asburiae]
MRDRCRLLTNFLLFHYLALNPVKLIGHAFPLPRLLTILLYDLTQPGLFLLPGLFNLTLQCTVFSTLRLLQGIRAFRGTRQMRDGLRMLLASGFFSQHLRHPLLFRRFEAHRVMQAALPPLSPVLAQRPGNLKPLTPGYATQASPSVTSSPTSSTTPGSAASGAAR